MEISLEDFVSTLDFEQYNYYYHETESGVGIDIMVSGLLIEGTNIIDTDNILFTTTLPFTIDEASDIENFVESERSVSSARRVCEMVILEVEKGREKEIVEPSGIYGYEVRVSSRYIKGYIDMDRCTFIANVYTDYYDR